MGFMSAMECVNLAISLVCMLAPVLTAIWYDHKETKNE